MLEVGTNFRTTLVDWFTTSYVATKRHRSYNVYKVCDKSRAKIIFKYNSNESSCYVCAMYVPEWQR